MPVEPPSPWKLRTSHRVRVLEAALTLCLVGIMLKALPFRWVASLLGPTARGRLPDRRSPNPTSRAVGAAVGAAARRLPWHPVCLPQAVTAAFMMRRRGLTSLLCLGVRLERGSMEAHAWLLEGADGAEGAVIGEGAAGQFSPIASLLCAPRRG